MFCFPKCLQSKMNQHYLRSCASHSFLLVFCFVFSRHAYLILITLFITFSALHPKSPWSQQQCSLIRLNGVMCQVVYLYTLQRKTIYSLVQVHKKNHLENPNRNLSHLIRKHLFTKLKFRCALNEKKKIGSFILRPHQFHLSHHVSGDCSCHQGVCPTPVKFLLSMGCVLSITVVDTVVTVDRQTK